MEEIWEIHCDMGLTDIDTRLAFARMALSTCQPMHYVTSWGESSIITPWQSYSRIYKEKYGVYPQMWGFTTLTD